MESLQVKFHLWLKALKAGRLEILGSNLCLARPNLSKFSVVFFDLCVNTGYVLLERPTWKANTPSPSSPCTPTQIIGCNHKQPFFQDKNSYCCFFLHFIVRLSRSQINIRMMTILFLKKLYITKN